MGNSNHWQRIRSPAAAGAKETNSTNDATSDRGMRFTLSLGELSALTATVGGLTYLMGLFVFALPIGRVYPVDFTEAWYATSLVPKTLVAGQGASGMLGLPLAFGVSIGFGLALYDLIRSNHRSVRTLWQKERAPGKVSLVFLLVFPAVFSGEWYFLYQSFLIGAVIMIVFLLMSVFVLRSRLRATNLNFKFDFFGRNARSLVLPIFILLFLSQFALNAVTVAQESDPPLPRVKITWVADPTNSTKAKITEGDLLTHTESFWYVLNKADQNKGGQDGGLTAIPDDKVQHVRIGPR
jgi:hypothetical protein